MREMAERFSGLRSSSMRIGTWEPGAMAVGSGVGLVGGCVPELAGSLGVGVDEA